MQIKFEFGDKISTQGLTISVSNGIIHVWNSRGGKVRVSDDERMCSIDASTLFIEPLAKEEKRGNAGGTADVF
jgi:hypothetical protein